jgi:hypothetical protein
VEFQHVTSTRRLVDTLAEQDALEQLLDQGKPAIPDPCAKLGYLLSTPFRYQPLRAGSRFRAQSDEGVFYGAEHLRTACAELGFHRVRFVRDSDGLQELAAVPHTLFAARASGLAIDLRKAPFAKQRRTWTDPDTNHYGPCQALARVARAARVGLIRYESVRDPEHGGCAAVLDCTALATRRDGPPRQTWFLSVDRERAEWTRAAERPGTGLEFRFPE